MSDLLQRLSDVYTMAVEIKKLQQQVVDLEARCKRLRDCMEQVGSMPGRDWLGGQLTLAKTLLEDDAAQRGVVDDSGGDE
jgi:hypothetical protein